MCGLGIFLSSPQGSQNFGLPPRSQGLSWVSIIFVLVGGFLSVGAGNAMNMYLERNTDRKMFRTRGRPLPREAFPPIYAFIVSIIACILSFSLLWFYSNPLTAYLSFASFILYSFIYTPLKKVTPWSLWIGAIPGAMPPFLGTTAETNSIEPLGIWLFCLLFIWQIPHFLAISIKHRADYERGDIKVFPSFWTESICKWKGFFCALCLVILSYFPGFHFFYSHETTLSLFHFGFLIFLSFLNIWYIWNHLPGNQNWSQKAFFSSLIYLPLFCLLIFIQSFT